MTMRPPPLVIMARTMCLVSTIGDTVLSRTSFSICAVVDGGEDAAGSVGGIVDKPMDAAERLAQVLGEIRDPVDVAEVERHEMQQRRAGIDRVGEFGEFLAGAPPRWRSLHNRRRSTAGRCRGPARGCRR